MRRNFDEIVWKKELKNSEDVHESNDNTKEELEKD